MERVKELLPEPRDPASVGTYNGIARVIRDNFGKYLANTRARELNRELPIPDSTIYQDVARLLVVSRGFNAQMFAEFNKQINLIVQGRSANASPMVQVAEVLALNAAIRGSTLFSTLARAACCRRGSILSGCPPAPPVVTMGPGMSVLGTPG